MIIEAILLTTLLSAEPAFINQTGEPDVELERKRSHKRRRKIRKPNKGLRYQVENIHDKRKRP